MEITNTHESGERGQVLVLFALLLGVLVLLVMTVVDVGFFVIERQRVQAAADAAALAGAQELPDNAVLAESIAIDYIEANGVDPDNVDITFACTSPQGVCDEATGVYDTIYVTPTSTAPAFLGGIFNLFGAGDSCWVDGCNVDATAGACRGACGAVGNGPADIVTILDHSGSMSSGDLAEAKDAILSMFGSLNHEFQQVSVALTPPVKPQDYCDSLDNWGDPEVWLPAPLTDTFQTSPGVLNYLSPPVDVIDCVQRGGPPGVHTNLGNPIEAATTELVASGRPDVTWGIVLVTDGAANVAPDNGGDSSTGQRFCDSQARVTSGSGDNNGYQRRASRACDNGNNYARDNNSGNGSSTSCTSSNKDRHDFWDFDLTSGIPGGATISGIEMRFDAWATGGSWGAVRKMCVQLSWDGGNSWTSNQSFDIGSSEQTFNIGGAADDWGRSWGINDLTNGNFRVRVTNVSDSSGKDFRLDAVAAEVYYDDSSGGGYQHKGPCDWAAYNADQAKALGIEVFTIAWGADNQCDRDDPSSPYYNMDAVEFLESLATDASHAFNEPKSADLEPIFYSIGTQLTAGSRLIQ